MKAVVLAALIALAGTLIGCRIVLALATRRRRVAARAARRVGRPDRGGGQATRTLEADGAEDDEEDDTAATFGGIAIVGSVLVAYVVAHLLVPGIPVSWSGVLVLGLAVALSFIGAHDDRDRLRSERSVDRRRRTRLISIGAVAAVFAVLAFQLPDDRGLTPASRAVSVLRDVAGLQLPLIAAMVWLLIMVVATSSGVKIVDGRDGLAAGTSVMVFGAFTLVNIWQRSQSCFRLPGPRCYEVRDPLDLALVSVSFAAACFGFLWWNIKPARVIMGDTGALALGGAIAALAIFTRTELLLVLLAGMVVLDSLSVVLQMAWFGLTRRRLLPMAPLHHTFEVMGWAEATVTIRLWILQGLMVVAGLAIFYGEWVSG